MARRRSLGKGLEALLGDDARPLEATAGGGDGLRELPLEMLQPGVYQPRSRPAQAGLEELARSIRSSGVVQPVLVRPLDGERYELVAGERRWRAAQIAGLEKIPALIRQIPDRDASCIALIENLQREDLNPIDAARALAGLHRDFKMTHEQIAERIGRSRVHVTHLVGLLELDPEVREMVEAGELDFGHARALLALPAAQQRYIATRVADQGLSVRATESLAQQAKSGNKREPAARRPADPDIQHLERVFSEKLASTVSIRHSARRNRGTLSIRYNSLEQLDGLLKRIR